ncbi:MAG: DUF3761 domain-containing protein [Granulicella sp.]
MKVSLKTLAIVIAFQCAAYAGLAQAPAGAPKGATGMCKDGTYATSQSKSAGCRGHKGVKDWYLGATTAPAPAAAASAPMATPTPTSAPKTMAPAAKPAPAVMSNMAAAPGGGAGKVWVNTATNVYHCSDDRYYGKTKAGQYMSEADAKAKHARPDHGNGCSK